MKFHVKPKVVFHYVSRETSIQALLCTIEQIWLKSTWPNYDSQFNMWCGLHYMIGSFNAHTSAVTDTKKSICSIQPNHLKYEIRSIMENDRPIRSTNYNG